MRVHAAVQQHLTKRRQVRRSAEHACVPGNSANRIGVLVMHLALHQTVAQLVIDFRWRNFRPQLLGRVVHRVLHADGIEDVFVCQHIERLAGQPLNNFRQQDDAQVGVDHFSAGLVLQRLRKNILQRVGLAL